MERKEQDISERMGEKKPIRFIETFCGIGGFRYGLENIHDLYATGKHEHETEDSPCGEKRGLELKQPAGLGDFVCVWSNEIDKYACQVYRKNFGKGELYEGDIRTVQPGDIPEAEMLVGGFPCQAFSIAGKRKGFEDTRGTLFYEIVRLARANRYKTLFLENVKGLLSHENGSTFETILRVLDELGYDVEWQVLNSKNFGVPQNRERVFIIGHLRGESFRQVFPIGEDGRLFDEKTGGNDKQTSHTKTQIARTINSRLHKMGDADNYVKVPSANKRGYEEAQEGDSINLSVPNSKTRRGRVGKGVAQTIDTGMQQHTIQDMKIRRLTPTECERLQGFPDGWTEGISDTQRYKCLGNAVTTNVIQAIGENL